MELKLVLCLGIGLLGVFLWGIAATKTVRSRHLLMRILIICGSILMVYAATLAYPLRYLP
jgi:hypothetical protein